VLCTSQATRHPINRSDHFLPQFPGGTRVPTIIFYRRSTGRESRCVSRYSHETSHHVYKKKSKSLQKLDALALPAMAETCSIEQNNCGLVCWLENNHTYQAAIVAAATTNSNNNDSNNSQEG